jgi:hypothetical protein
LIALRERMSDSSTNIEFMINSKAAQVISDASFNRKRGVSVGYSETVITALDK